MEKVQSIQKDVKDICVFTLLVVIWAFVLMILLSGLVIRDTVVAIQRRFKRAKHA